MVKIAPSLVSEVGLSASDVETLVNDIVCNSGIDIGPVTVEFDDSSDAEEGRNVRFFAGGCSCKLANGGPCHKSITLSEYRVMCDRQNGNFCTRITR